MIQAVQVIDEITRSNILNLFPEYDIAYEYTVEPIENATVSLTGYATQTTNSSGVAEFSDVVPANDIAYTITATGLGGTATDDVTIVVENASPLPSINLTASPETIAKGESTTLSWDSENATSVHIDQGIGLVSANDTWDVSPAHTTMYTITATGSVGSVSASVLVNVTATPAAQLFIIVSSGARPSKLAP